jgi:hypothetical protein
VADDVEGLLCLTRQPAQTGAAAACRNHSTRERELQRTAACSQRRRNLQQRHPSQPKAELQQVRARLAAAAMLDII